MAEELDMDAIDLDQFENPGVVRQLRDNARRFQKEASEGSAAKRELAILKAGVDTSSKVGQLFLRSFDGDVSDIEAIKAEWAEIAPAPAAATTTTEQQVETPATAEAETETPAELTGSAERRSLAEGAAPGGQTSPNAREQLLERAQEAKKVGDWDHAAGGFLHGLVEGYYDGSVKALEPTGRRAGE